MTQCKSNVRSKQPSMQLELGFGKPVEARFDGDCISTDGGLTLLRKADDRLELTKLAAWCIRDDRRPDLVKHKLENLLKQRIYAIAAGYEDCNDAAKLGSDGMHKLALGFLPKSEHRLASQPTLSRWENSVDDVALKAMQKLLVHTYIRRHKKRPKTIRLAMIQAVTRFTDFNNCRFTMAFTKNIVLRPCLSSTMMASRWLLCCVTAMQVPANTALRWFEKLCTNSGWHGQA